LDESVVTGVIAEERVNKPTHELSINSLLHQLTFSLVISRTWTH